MDNKSLGSRGEEAAAVYLMRHGYEILEIILAHLMILMVSYHDTLPQITT